jgi:5'-nucleotidase
VAYLATVLDKLREPAQNQVFVAAGDLVGASPQMSSLLKDEPTLSALGELGLGRFVTGQPRSGCRFA